MSKFDVRHEVTPLDIERMVAQMHDCDFEECYLTIGPGGPTVYEALTRCVDASVMVQCVYDREGTLLTMFGLVSPNGLLDDTGSPWMLRTPALRPYARDMMRGAPAVIARYLELHPVLMNFVWQHNRPAKRWLTSVGFTLFDPVPYGLFGELFHPFELRAT